MASTINAHSSDGLIITSDTSGEIKLQAAGADVATLDSSGITMGTGMTIPAASLTGTMPSSSMPALKTINGSSISGSGDIEVGGGKILQVVNTLTSTRAAYTANNNNVGTNISPIQTAITPSATSSKVWITITISFESHHDTMFRLYRGSTIIGRNTASTARWSGTFVPGYDVDNGSTSRTNTYTYLDSPNTTSAITYKLHIQSSSGANYTLYLNRTTGSTGADAHEVGTSSMTLMEVGA